VWAQTAPSPRSAAPDPQAVAETIDKALQRAGADRAAGRLDQAEQQLRSVASRFKSVRALLELAEVQAQQGHQDRSLASLKEARSLAPNSEDVLAAYAEALLASSDSDAAVPVLVALTRMCPMVARYQRLYGTALLRAGDAPAASACLREAARLEPDQASTLVALGQALNRQGHYADAKAELLRGLSLMPESVEVVAALAEAEMGLGELNAAEDRARQVLARSEHDPTANLVIAMALMQQEKFAEARDALLKAAAADPSSPKIQYQLSLAYARLGDTASSERSLALYDQRTKEARARVEKVRGITGFSMGGMQP
jgi:predicted Zn-dependent protease